MMAYAPRIAHAACRYHHEEACQAIDRLALLHGIGEPQFGGNQSLTQDVAVLDFIGMSLEYGACARGQRRIDEYWGSGNLAGLHEQMKVNQQFLRPLDGEGRNDQGTVRPCGAAHDVAEHPASPVRRNVGAIPAAISRFADEIVDRGRTLRVGLEQFVPRTYVARKHDADRRAPTSINFQLD